MDWIMLVLVRPNIFRLFKLNVWFADQFSKPMIWFAEGYRQGNKLEKNCIFPCWLLFRILFLITQLNAKILHKIYHARGVEQSGSLPGS